MEGVVSIKLLASSLGRLPLNLGFAPSLGVVMAMMLTLLVGSAAILLEVDQSSSRLLRAGVVATTKDDDVLCAIVFALVVASSTGAPFNWPEAIVDLVASTAPPISSFGPGFPVNVV